MLDVARGDQDQKRDVGGKTEPEDKLPEGFKSVGGRRDGSHDDAYVADEVRGVDVFKLELHQVAHREPNDEHGMKQNGYAPDEECRYIGKGSNVCGQLHQSH